MQTYRRLLIGGDNKEKLEGLARIFGDEYEPVQVCGLSETQNMLMSERENISAVILAFGDRDGMSVIEMMKSDDIIDSIPVIFISGENNVVSERGALKAGVSDYVTEPFDEETLRQRLSNIMQRSADAQQGRRTYDKLTGIFTRTTFFRETRVMLNDNPDTDFLMIYWNIERFKLINNTFGIKVGNLILKNLADGIRREFRKSKKPGTYGHAGGDHFIMCMPESGFSPDDLLQKLNVSIAEDIIEYRITSFLGIYPVDDRTLPVSVMCDRAFMALEKVEEDSLQPYAYYEDTFLKDMLREQEIIRGVYSALERDEFEVYYQPIYSVTEGRPIYSEALVRWNRAEGENISAGEFIPVMEKRGLITSLDRVIWGKVCTQISRWQRAGREVLPVSVNISRADLYSPGFFDELIAIMEEHDIDPSFLKLEITETAYIENPKLLPEKIKTLQSHGFDVLMDDFGSGYSSLNMLKEIPVDILKIDLKFLGAFDTNERSANILTSVVRMAKWLRIPVIVEGVETKNQFDFLRSIGCDMMQGYFFQKPVPVDEFELFVDNYRAVANDISDIRWENINFNDIFDNGYLVTRIFNKIIGGIGIYEFNGETLEIIRVNDAYYEIMGVTPQQFFRFASEDALSRVAEEDRDILRTQCRRVIEERGECQIKLRRRMDDKTFIWLGGTVVYLGSSNGNPLLCFVFTDITEQKHRESKIRFNKYIEALKVFYDEIYDIDIEQQTAKLIYSRCEEGFPWSMTKDFDRLSLGKWAGKHIHPDDRESFYGILDALTRMKKHYKDLISPGIEVRVSSGKNKYTWISFSFIYVEENRFFAGIINVQRKKEKELTETDEEMDPGYRKGLYRRIAAQTGIIFMEFDPGSGSFFCTDNFGNFEASGLQNEETGLVEALLKTVHEFDRDILKEFLVKTWQTKENGEALVRLQRSDKEYVWCLLRNIFEEDDEGRMSHITVVMTEAGIKGETAETLKKHLEASARQMDCLSNIYNMLPCAVIHYTMEYPPAMISYNRTGAELLGYEWKGCNKPESKADIMDFIFKDDREMMAETIHDFIESRKPTSYRYRVICGNGEIKWVKGIFYDFESPDGQDAMVSVFLEIPRENGAEEQLPGSNELYRGLMEFTESVILELDLDRDSMFLSMCGADGRRKEKYLENYFEKIDDDKTIAPSHISEYRRKMAAAAKSVLKGNLEYQADYFGGGYSWFRLYYESFADHDDGRVDRILGRAVSIEKEKKIEEKLQQEKNYRDAFFKEMLAVYEINSGSGTSLLLYRNEKKAVRYFPFSCYMNTQKNNEYIYPDDVQKINRYIRIMTGTTENGKIDEDLKLQCRIRNRQQEWVWVEFTAHMFRSGHSENIETVIYAEEIDEEKKHTDKLMNKAQTDAVSKLYNRGTTEEKINQLLDSRKRSLQHTMFILDIDNFKVLNDSFGHLTGDDIIRRISRILVGVFRKTDVVGRIGGDEFAVLMGSVSSDRQINERMRLIMQQIHRLPAETGTGIAVSVSVGITKTVPADHIFDDVYRRADAALYAAKTKGKDCYVIK